MASTSPTVIDLKIEFLRQQIRNLSAPLRPSPTFTASNAALAAETALREKAIDDALYKLNAQLRKHNKLVYGPQATRHVAEQIDRLYWSAGERGTQAGKYEEEDWKDRGSDLRDPAIIDQLPQEYSTTAAERMPEEAAKFTELSTKLKELGERRKGVQQRLESYGRIRELVDPFDAEGEVQNNLVTKNGDVEKELEKTRMLMLRVERGLEGLRRSPMEEDMDWEKEADDALKTVVK